MDEILERPVETSRNFESSVLSTSSNEPAPEAPVSTGSALSFAGSPEAVVAAALLSMEDAEERQETLRSKALEQRFQQRREAIRHERRAARFTLASGLLSGLAEIAKGASALVGTGSSSGDTGSDATAGGAAFRSNVALQAVHGSSLLSSSVLGFKAKEVELEGEWDALKSEAFDEAADRASRARDKAAKSADRMLDGMQELGRLRHEAALAALRV